MICKSIERTIAIGDKRLDYKKIIFKVIEFLDEHIEGYPKYLSNSNADDGNEKLLNQILVAYLNMVSSSCFAIETFKFYFDKDTSLEGSAYNPDIGVMLSNRFGMSKYSFFHIECKRLPARAGHEREYVQGKLGGIQRFKEGYHGKGLDYSAMVGYVQTGTFETWYKDINSWVNELIQSENKIHWQNEDKIIPRSIESYQKYTSSHTRLQHVKPIELYHYWVRV
jgi:hypothetical protein